MTTDDQTRICVPVCVRRADELRAAVARAAAFGDMIELRLDCLADEAQLEAATRELPALFTERTRAFILTFRPPEQGGGHSAADMARRVHFWTENFSPGHERADFADLELDLAVHLKEREDAGGRQLIDWNRVICSHHDFEEVPADLELIFARLLAAPARILKLALRARDITDTLPLLHLLERARSAGREMIAVAMGEAGSLTRILAPARGAFLTYGALTRADATAPGQIDAKNLRDLYRVRAIDGQTQITGLIGSPVAHSFSPAMHNAAFAARGLNAAYLPFAVRDAGAFIRRMAHPRTRELVWPLRGLSVTAPHKSTIMSQLDFIEASAGEIGAVNTIVVEGNTLSGFNTDAAAALAPLVELIELRGARVAVLGAGGAARALLWSLREAGARVTVYARNMERARAMGEKFGAHARTLEGAQFDNFDLVINTTPLGTRGDNEVETPACADQLRGARAAYDLVYNPDETRFMREARVAGCEVVLGGLPMLVAQAAAQFKLWTGEDAPLEAMHAAAEQQRSQVGY